MIKIVELDWKIILNIQQSAVFIVLLHGIVTALGNDYFITLTEAKRIVSVTLLALQSIKNVIR